MELRDEFSKKTYAVKPRLILNCAGAWIDTVRQLAGLSGELVTRSRGTHLILDRIANDPLIFSAPEKGRVFFVLPVGSDASVIGTTDILETGNPDVSHPAPQECQVLLQLLKRFFPDKTPVVRSLYWERATALQTTRIRSVMPHGNINWSAKKKDSGLCPA